VKSTIDGKLACTWVKRFAYEVDQARERLADLDRQAGDGDFADNVTGALGAAVSYVEALEAPTAGEVFDAVARAFRGAGGSSGPLLASWFEAFGQEGGVSGKLSAGAVARAVKVGTDNVQKLGHARLGDKTMVDAMLPAVGAVCDATGSVEVTVDVCLVAAARSAREGAEATRSLRARRGRATYVGEAAVGVIDPGALAIAMFFQAGADAIAQMA